jgi:hypothetical protein
LCGFAAAEKSCYRVDLNHPAKVSKRCFSDGRSGKSTGGVNRCPQRRDGLVKRADGVFACEIDGGDDSNALMSRQRKTGWLGCAVRWDVDGRAAIDEHFHDAGSEGSATAGHDDVTIRIIEFHVGLSDQTSAGHGLAMHGFVSSPVLGLIDNRLLTGGLLAVAFDGDEGRRRLARRATRFVMVTNLVFMKE